MRSLAAQLVRRLPTPDLRTDGDLLRGFLEQGVEDDFAELVRRHGPLVWGVCCRALPDVADAEDAFQATFLVLVRRGRKLTGFPTIGPWLHKVAAWTARNVRRHNARRLARQAALPVQLPAPNRDLDLPLDIDAALLSLPEKFRSPIVLCHLLGYSRADAAARLGCAEGTLSAWLARGLAKLRTRFGGLDPAKPLVVALAVPAALSESVVRAAVSSRVAWAASAAVSSTVSQVVEGVMRMFWIKKATALAATVFAVFAFGIGVGITGRQVEGVVEGQEKTALAEVSNHEVLSQAVIADILKLEEKLARIRVQQGLVIVGGRVDPRASWRVQQSRLELLEDMDLTMKEARLLMERLSKQLPAQQKERGSQSDQSAKMKRLEELKKEEEAQARELKKQLNALQTKLNPRRGHLDLIIRGSAGYYEFALREMGADEKEVGTVVVAGTANGGRMLAILLARTKADPLAPRELRVLASPSTALGIGSIEALKACDAAGYAKVKFTGYVIAGGYTPELKADQKGDVPGYKHYDNIERTPTSLIQEIEKGRVTY
jgi:RNA polymerase sigma factor (sigma-70 family)